MRERHNNAVGSDASPGLSGVTSHTVTFDSQGGSSIPPQTVTAGSTVTRPANPAREDHTFDGWYKEAACVNPWDFNTDTVTENTTLYAKWTADSGGGGGSGGCGGCDAGLGVFGLLALAFGLLKRR